MADEAFALSPISARAAQPSEEDYDAISDAFMETSRGRWFLGEYAKRNRNADTSMVLDAVARIEENLAAQRHLASHVELAEALAGIRKAVDEARTAASIAIDGLALEQTLAPIRKGARVVREIAWRWREIGTDGRICDLLDSQVNSIEAGCGRIASIDPRGELGAAFDLITGRIAEFDDSDAPSPRAAEKAAAEVPAAAAVETAPAGTSLEAATGTSASAAEAVPATEEAAELTAEAHDDAVLDMVAMEMAAPDPFDDDLAETQAPEPPPLRSEAIARQPEPPAAPAMQPAPRPLLQPSPQHSLQPSLQPSLEPSRAPSLEPSPEPSPEPSLGSSLIASGILSKPKASGPDPLAPIRRMSQAEKLAFFS